MADNSEANERYVETLAILTVLVQIRQGTVGDPTEKDIEAAKYAYDRVKNKS
jgi:hypothetical protein